MSLLQQQKSLAHWQFLWLNDALSTLFWESRELKEPLEVISAWQLLCECCWHCCVGLSLQDTWKLWDVLGEQMKSSKLSKVFAATRSCWGNWKHAQDSWWELGHWDFVSDLEFHPVLLLFQFLKLITIGSCRAFVWGVLITQVSGPVFNSIK